MSPQKRILCAALILEMRPLSIWPMRIPWEYLCLTFRMGILGPSAQTLGIYYENINIAFHLGHGGRSLRYLQGQRY